MWLRTASSAASAARETLGLPDVWAWPGWTALGALFAAVAAIAAVVAIRYARDSARAALHTVEPMKIMAANLGDAAGLLDRIEGRFAATAAIMEKNLQVAEERYEKASSRWCVSAG